MLHTHRPRCRHPDNITFAAIEKIAADEACLALFEALRFPGGLRCASCGADERRGTGFTRHRSRPGLYICGGCRRQFFITSKPVPEGQKGLRWSAFRYRRPRLRQRHRNAPHEAVSWPVAEGHLTSVVSSKGISARQLGEMLGRTCKMACRRQITLSGIVEISEICTGAPPRERHGGRPTDIPIGRGSRRLLILTMAKRGNSPRSGSVVFESIASHSSAAIGRTVAAIVIPDATIITDALPAYRRVAAAQEHLTMIHYARQYVMPDAG